jgi:hypothetical protein
LEALNDPVFILEPTKLLNFVTRTAMTFQLALSGLDAKVQSNLIGFCPLGSWAFWIGPIDVFSINGAFVYVFKVSFLILDFPHRAMTAALACSLERALRGPLALPPLRPKLAM